MLDPEVGHRAAEVNRRLLSFHKPSVVQLGTRHSHQFHFFANRFHKFLGQARKLVPRNNRRRDSPITAPIIEQVNIVFQQVDNAAQLWTGAKRPIVRHRFDRKFSLDLIDDI